MSNTTLQQAIIDAGMTAIPFGTTEKDYSIPVAELPDATLIRVLQYGKRMFNDFVNSAKATSDTPVDELAAGWIERAKAGTLGQAGTRQTADPYIKAQRDIVTGMLRQLGVKAVDARKAASDPQKGFVDVLAAKIKMATGQPAPSDAITAAFDANWPKVQAEAERMVAASRVSLDLDV